MRSKICPYCLAVFLEIDFPYNFDGMSTCGSKDCVEKRLIELGGLEQKTKGETLLGLMPENSKFSNQTNQKIKNNKNYGGLK